MSAFDFSKLRAMTHFILRNATAFEWRLQGMGMLQLRLTSDMRLHIWDDRFAVPNVSMIHDHLQWGLHSTIISGELRNVRYADKKYMEYGEPYDYAVFEAGEGAHMAKPPECRWLAVIDSIRYRPGESYVQQPEEIHETKAERGTVTIMSQFRTGSSQARIFWPRGTEWVSAEPRRATPGEITSIAENALENWTP